jgi:hypothetical protein
MKKLLWLFALYLIVTVHSYVRQGMRKPIRVSYAHSIAASTAPLNNVHHHMELDFAKLLTNFLFQGQNKFKFDAKLLPSIIYGAGSKFSLKFVP